MSLIQGALGEGMRHRIGAGANIGLGNPNKCELDNKGISRIPFEMFNDFLKRYGGGQFSDYDGCDFTANKNMVALGWEPGYYYEPLFIICICRDIDESYITRGKAWGPYGSGIARNTKRYSDYKNKSKFVKFVDHWHSVIFAQK